MTLTTGPVLTPLESPVSLHAVALQNQNTIDLEI